MNIPKTIKIAGVEYAIEFDNKELDKDGILGQSSVIDSTIKLSSTYRYVERSKLSIEQVFWHEVTHAILDTMQEDELNENEKFVNTFAAFLHQIINDNYKLIKK